MFARNLRSLSRSIQPVSGSIRNMGHGGPLMPPFARLPPPTSSLHEEVELVWDDGVAPETAVDFDSVDIPISRILKHMAMAFGFLGLIMLKVYLDEPEKNDPAVPRSHNQVVSRLATLHDCGHLLTEEQLEELKAEEAEH